MKQIVSKLRNIIQIEKKYRYLKNLESSKYAHFLEKEYKKRTGESLDLKQPRKYTEKMQYAKLYLNTQLKTKLTDKYLVREWVSKKIGSEYLIPLIGVWESFNDLKFETLPSKFVLKTNHGSGTNIIVDDKSQFNHLKGKFNFDSWLNKNYAYMAGDLQLHYKDIEPKIIAEEYIEDSKGELNDYKFLCFDGTPYYCWLDIGRHSNQHRNMYDMEWNLQPWNYNKFSNYSKEIPKPKNFEKMVEVAAILSEGFSHVRVDLYNVDGKIYFGEMTFTSSGGYTLMYPTKYNYKLGELWDISNIKQNNE